MKKQTAFARNIKALREDSGLTQVELGKKLETELLYWDMKKELIYSDRYVKLSADGQIIEGNNGFHSDQNLNHPVFENISGSIEVEKQQRKQ